MNALSAEERELFYEYLRIPSISARSAHAPDVRACANWLKNLLGSWGLSAEIAETKGAPVVFAKTRRLEGLPTVLLYGHYDVQPVEPLELWTGLPFEPAERDGCFFARGATDNKGQTFSHLIGLKRMLEAGSLPLNLTILLEGEEEIGSPNLETFLASRGSELTCDVVLVSDTSMIAKGWPALTLGLRGIACFECEITGPSADLHSGMFGGGVVNPGMAMARILASLYAEDGSIALPGFYDGVTEVSQAEKESWNGLPWDEAWIAQTTGTPAGGGEKARSLLERLWTRPTAEINGLTCGYQGEGSKTIIPAVASAKLSFRLVGEQDPDRIAELVLDWWGKRLSEEGVAGRMAYDHGGHPFSTSPEDPWIRIAAETLASVFGRAPSFTREGLSIPVVSMLAKKFGVPIVLAGLGLPDCQAHAPNESFPVANFELGVTFHMLLMRNWAARSLKI
ncbi:dipeptidase [soil metagenome]